MELTKTEEILMEIIWSNGKIFMKDIIEAYAEPKPAVTTIATLLKRMQDKNFIDYKVFGNSREYFPKVKKEAYFKKHVSGLIKNYFSNSPMQFASFFTKSSNFSNEQLEELKKIIENQITEKS